MDFERPTLLLTTWIGAKHESSLRHFLADLRSRDKLLVVSREVDPEYELNAVVRKIQATRNLPVFFEKIRGSRFPVVSNTLGNYGIIAGLLGVDIGQVAARWSRLTGPSSAKVEKQFDAEKAEYEKIALSEIPHITYSEKDAGPYLTASVIIAQDPDSSITNLSFHRMQIVGPAELRCRLSTWVIVPHPAKDGAARTSVEGGGGHWIASCGHARGGHHGWSG